LNIKIAAVALAKAEASALSLVLDCTDDRSEDCAARAPALACEIRPPTLTAAERTSLADPSGRCERNRARQNAN
jgi:hypothetical protein